MDFVGPILCLFYAYSAVFLHVKYCVTGIFGFFTVELRILPDKIGSTAKVIMFNAFGTICLHYYLRNDYITSYWHKLKIQSLLHLCGN